MTDTTRDPILEEVWEARRKVVEAAAAKGQTLGAYLREAQRVHGERLVRRDPKRLIQNNTA